MSRKPSIIESLEQREKALRKEKERLRRLGESLHEPKDAERLLREEDKLLDAVTKSKHPSPSTQVARNFREKGAFSIEAEISALQDCATLRREQRRRESARTGQDEESRGRGVGKRHKKHGKKHGK